MAHRLLFFLFIFSSFSVYSQGPPPCGIIALYGCDNDGDGFEVFNLVEEFPFATFCMSSGEDENNYSSIVFYETEDDMNNEINPITNPFAYSNISNPQTIYYRVNAINLDASYEFLKSTDNLIQILDESTFNAPTPMILCDSNNNGTNTFRLVNKDKEILAGLDSNLYSINYYESLVDAESNINPLAKESYTNFVNPQTVYARVLNLNNSCYTILPMDLIVQEECNDIAVYLISKSLPRPGFPHYNYLTVKNVGTSRDVSGSIEFKMDPLVTFNNVLSVSSGNSVTNTATGFILNFVNLQPGEREYIEISMNVPVATSLGTLLTNTAIYSESDLNLENNTSTLSVTVVGSYDPNDIAESHGPEILYSSFSSNDYLYYTIRFQNVGTADAINVSIDNTLNAKLDKSTIQMLSASHDYVFTRTDDLLNWQFDDIHLPSEDMDEPNSHGYVYYKIKPLVGYSIGDVIPNTAEIYFDFNPAVVTNTFNTEFVTTLSSETLDTDAFLVLPNPTSDVVKLKFSRISNKQINISIYDIHGKEIINVSKNLNNRSVELDVRQLAKGVYFLKVNTGDLEKVKKMIIN